MPRLKRKSQSSIEFVIIMSFALIFLGFMAGILQSSLASANEERDSARIGQLMNVLESEIAYAKESDSGYTRRFFLPLSIDGDGYDIMSNDGSDVVITYKAKTYVYFLSDTLVNYGALGPGYNTIQKSCGPFSCSISLV